MNDLNMQMNALSSYFTCFIVRALLSMHASRPVGWVTFISKSDEFYLIWFYLSCIRSVLNSTS